MRTADRPNPDGSFFPRRIGRKSGQQSTTVLYVFPSRSEKLKNKLPHYIAECKPFDTKKRVVGPSVLVVPDIASCTEGCLAPKTSNPNLCIARDDK